MREDEIPQVEGKLSKIYKLIKKRLNDVINDDLVLNIVKNTFKSFQTSFLKNIVVKNNDDKSFFVDLIFNDASLNEEDESFLISLEDRKLLF